MEEYFQNNADLDIERARDEYKYIWSKNITQVELIREKNPQAGDYFHEDESNIELRKRIWMNIQGLSNSEAYKRADMGIITPDATLHGYVLWDEDIQDMDIIKFEKRTYRISGFNKSRYGGQVVFQDFDLNHIDQEETSVGGSC